MAVPSVENSRLACSASPNTDMRRTLGRELKEACKKGDRGEIEATLERIRPIHPKGPVIHQAIGDAIESMPNRFLQAVVDMNSADFSDDSSSASTPSEPSSRCPSRQANDSLSCSSSLASSSRNPEIFREELERAALELDVPKTKELIKRFEYLNVSCDPRLTKMFSKIIRHLETLKPMQKTKELEKIKHLLEKAKRLAF